MRDVTQQSCTCLGAPEGNGAAFYRVIANDIDPGHKDHLHLHVHGGPTSLTVDWDVSYKPAISLGTKMRALSIDYSMAPRHPLPAAIDDVVPVYRRLLTQRPARSMAKDGRSAGGVITLSAVQQIIELGVDLPGVLFIGRPGYDLSGTGATFQTNQAVDRNIPIYDGLIAARVRLHAH